MRYTAMQYAKTLYDLLEAEPKNTALVIRNVAKTLLSNGQAGLARSVAEQFKSVWYTRKKITAVEVTTAEKGLVGVTQLEKMLGDKIELNENVDPKVGAGARIKIGDYQVDNTLARRLSDLRNALIH